MAREAELLCRKGCTDLEMAAFFQVDMLTIWRWKHSHEEFCKAVTRGKEVADALVERMHFERAVGYSYPAVKIFMPAGAKEAVKVEYMEHVPPDVGAQKNWLNNRDPDRWKDRREEVHIPDPETQKRRDIAFAALLAMIESDQEAPMLELNPKGPR